MENGVGPSLCRARADAEHHPIADQAVFVPLPPT
jgi:hypothetical protein